MNMDRRVFLTSFIRYFIGMTIGITSAILLFKGRGVNPNSCPPELVCQKCNQFSSCNLPKKAPR